MASSWSQLPLDILGSILERLRLVDHLLLASVCVSWRSAVRSNTFRPAPQPPWLMLPASPNQDAKTVSFFSDNKVYNIPHQPDPPMRTRVNIGSSMGWLITADERSKLHLLNPLTRSQINLPPIGTLPNVKLLRPWDREYYLVDKQTPETFTAEELRHYLYVKAILVPSSQASNSSHSKPSFDYLVVLIYNPNGRLAFAKPGDYSWTTLQETSYGFRDVIYHKGKCYTLDNRGNVEAWDLSGPSPKSTFRAPELFERGFNGEVRYLVESSSGDLLQVLQIHRWRGLFVSDHEVYRIIRFKIFKLDLTEYGWVDVKGLGNEALFLGNSHSASLSNFPELRGNSIYFTPIPYEFIGGMKCYTGTLIFNLEDQRVEKFCPQISSDGSPLPIWITPHLARSGLGKTRDFNRFIDRWYPLVYAVLFIIHYIFKFLYEWYNHAIACH